MSRIASNPSTAGKPRRITANWEFEHSNSCSEQIIITPSDVKLGSGMTDARDRKPSKVRNIPGIMSVVAIYLAASKEGVSTV